MHSSKISGVQDAKSHNTLMPRSTEDMSKDHNKNIYLFRKDENF